MIITKKGNLASFYTINKAPISHLRVYFNPQQGGTGDASPTNVRAINGHTSTKITHCGKNLLSCNIFSDYSANGVKTTYTTTENNEINEITITGTSTKNNNLFINLNYQLNKLNWPPDGNYATYAYSDQATIPFVSNLSSPKDTWGIAVGDNKARWKSYNLQHKNDTSEWVRIQLMPHDNNIGTVYNTVVKPLICIEADKGCDYEPYKGTTYNIDWNESVGTLYGGYLDLITGQLVKTHACIIAGVTNNFQDSTLATISTINNDEDTRFWIGIAESHGCPRRKDDTTLICNMLKANTTIGYGYYNSGHNICGAVNEYPQSIWCIMPTSLVGTTKESINNYLNTNHFSYCFEMNTPVVYQLTPTEINTFIGRNNIWSNVDYVEIEYELAESNSELYHRRSIILNGQPHIEHTNGSIISFNTDMGNTPLKSLNAQPNTIIRRTGSNVWDEQMQIGILNSDGTISSSTDTRLVSSLISVVPGETYQYVQKKTTNRGRAAFYDSNGDLLKYMNDFPENKDDYCYENGVQYFLFTVPNDARFLRFCTHTQYGTTYGYDISINYNTTGVEYFPYNGQVYSYPEQIKTLKGINNIWSDSGTITAEYWTYNTLSLPPEYKKCDYIRTISHNAQFDSGVPGDDTTLRIEFDWMMSMGTASGYGSYYGPFGQLNVSGEQRWCMYRTTYSNDPNATFWMVYAGTGVVTYIHPFGTGVTCENKKMHCIFEYGTASINGISASSSSTNPLNGEHIYFGTTSPTSSGIANNYGYFWYIKMWSHGELIRNYVPCYRKSDNKAGFYDTVNNTFNPSIGSAEFVAGND